MFKAGQNGKGWGWVFLFVAVACAASFHFQKEKKGALSDLASRLEEMEKEKSMALEEREDLLLRLASQKDPAWVEVILMRDLGVVPEGWLKVHFTKYTHER